MMTLKVYVRIIHVFYWNDYEGNISKIRYYNFKNNIRDGEDIMLDDMSRWEL